MNPLIISNLTLGVNVASINLFKVNILASSELIFPQLIDLFKINILPQFLQY